MKIIIDRIFIQKCHFQDNLGCDPDIIFFGRDFFYRNIEPNYLNLCHAGDWSILGCKILFTNERDFEFMVCSSSIIESAIKNNVDYIECLPTVGSDQWSSDPRSISPLINRIDCVSFKISNCKKRSYELNINR